MYICKYCSRNFNKNYALTYHINVKHLKITKQPSVTNKLECPKCKRNITVSNFNKHLKSCGKIVNHKDTLELMSKCMINILVQYVIKNIQKWE